ncbi:hypothetical protein [Lactobacillus pentosus] [Lactiplantibacillus mudanjiangensis]|nr:hypothetical protein [Lactobacillus pentosus] [Lactiplantibacillus mudanjiangensis]
MKLADIAHNLAHVIRDRSSDAPYNMVVKFTAADSNGKPA